MKITAVIVTCNRLELLPRALKSVRKQTRKPDFVYIISNSTAKNFEKEQKLCADLGFTIFKNQRTENNAGALNTAIEEVIKQFEINENVYTAFLDDDDEWHSDYLRILEAENHHSYDVLLAELSRNNWKSNSIQVLPKTINTNCFLKGNPGIGNSNTFVKLSLILKAGCFDETCLSNIDRDFFIRLFQLNPTYKVINKHLVNHFTDNDRQRITNDISIRKESFQYFYFKNSTFMSNEIKREYFEWANKLFNIEQSDIEVKGYAEPHFHNNDICFSKKQNLYQLVIGFIAGNDKIAKRVVKQIIQKIPADLILIIDDAPKSENLDGAYKLLSESNIPFKIVRYKEWNTNLANGYYGVYFEKFDDINSIPLGRTILHRHLFDETAQYENPVYWIIDDDIDLNTISTSETHFQLFGLINEHINKTDAIIGGISNDPPIPALSCIRTQLVDFLHSFGNKVNSDFKNNYQKSDYYYDLSDLHTDHLETPILKAGINEEHLHQIFSGKAVFRPALQRELKSEYKTISRRGANTLVLNREVLRLYPVINLEVNDKFARRGDLTWALFNQVVSNKKIIEHTFCINHNRPLSAFNLDKELDKSAYDIIGYAFNKAIFEVIENIKKNKKTDVFEELLAESNFKELKRIYIFYLQRRKARFTMNYYRIIGLTKIISEKFVFGNEYHEQFKDERKFSLFEDKLLNAISETHLRKFLEELKLIIEENKTFATTK